MYVSDTSIFPHSGLRVRITNMNGQDFITELKSDMKIDELKIISLSHFSSPAESMKKIPISSYSYGAYRKSLVRRENRI